MYQLRPCILVLSIVIGPLCDWFFAALQYPLCLSLLEHKRVNVKPMITHRFGFNEAGLTDGFDTAARSAQTKAIKVNLLMLSSPA